MGPKLYIQSWKKLFTGVCVLIKANVQHTIHSTVMDQEGRFIILDIEVHDIRMTLANLYAPNQDDQHFFQHLKIEIECIPNDNRIIGGDYNPGVGVTKAPFVDFSVSKIFVLAKVPLRLFESHLYLTGATAAELRRHLSNINAISSRWLKYVCYVKATCYIFMLHVA